MQTPADRQKLSRQTSGRQDPLHHCITHHCITACAGGYSGDPVDARRECVTAEGLGHVLCCAWKDDNAGPHTPDEVRSVKASISRSAGVKSRVMADTY